MLNLTPHPIALRLADGTTTTIPASGTIARVAMQETVTALTVAGVPVITRQPGEITGLPPADDIATAGGAIVSAMVLSAIPAGTACIYAPDTGHTAIRDEAGRIIAVTRLVSA